MMLTSGKIFLRALAFCFFWLSYSNTFAQNIQTTPNVIQQYGWQGCLTQHPGWIWGGTSGGPCPVQRAGDGAILFSYGDTTLSQTVQANKVLEGTGIRIHGYDYGWTVKNANAGAGQNPSSDPLSFTVAVRDAEGKVVEQKAYDYSFRIDNWTRFSGKETFTNPYSLANISTVTLSMRGKDAGYWAGYYAAEINDVSLKLNYSVDPCVGNPLFAPSCPGYEQAYLTQQCSMNALYSPQCPGYAQAYFNMQCSANPLYNPSCPGYQQAYFNQQCSISALFNPQCPGYAQAFLTQQCNITQLYSPQCPGYESAFLNQQCTASQLYSPKCPGYAEAFRNKQLADACSANPQGNPSCKGYVAPQIQTTTTTSVIAAVPPAIILPGADPVKSMTQPKLVEDPIVNQTLTKEPTKTETATQPPQQPPTAQRSGTREQSTTTRESQRSQTSTARASASSQPRQSVNEKKEEDKMAAFVPPPGFSAYEGARLPDLPFYRTEDIYRRVTLPDNARAQRLLNQRSDRLHKEMVDEQYRR
jgi:hypothetical protein